MKLHQYRKKLLEDAFSARVSFSPEQVPEAQTCELCGESAVFALSNAESTFSVGLSTILQCLKAAETEGLVPELPFPWWFQVEGRHGIKTLSQEM